MVGNHSPIIKNRYDAVLLFDVHEGNPNGDPDGDNAPRTDPYSQQGLVTDVCLKRKLRNFVETTGGGNTHCRIFVTEGSVLADKKREAYAQTGVALTEASDSEDDGKTKKKVKRSGEGVEQVRQYMCGNYWDIRTFGAVMNTNVPAGTVRGPVQITFARSIDRVDPSRYTITRMAVETTKEAERMEGDNRTMGGKWTIPYGLYRAHLFITPGDAAKTGFTEEDLELLKQGLRMMFDLDRSAGRGLMTMRGVYAFRHQNALGMEQAGRLFSQITVERKSNVQVPMKFSDYVVSTPTSLPNGVTLETWV